MEPYYWKTEDPHADNSVTMSDYLNNEMDNSFSIILVDGTYAEIKTNHGKFAVHASGNGDFLNHKVEFVKL